MSMTWRLEEFLPLFGREIEQLITLRDVETLSDLLTRSRSREKNERDAAFVFDDHEYGDNALYRGAVDSGQTTADRNAL